GIALGGIEEWGLQNAGREVDGVELWIVIGVDGGGSHRPLGAVYRLTDFVQLALKLEARSLGNVGGKVVRHNLYARVITPLVRIANLVFDGVKFNFRLFLGFRAHPVERLNLFAQRGFDVVNHFGDTLLARRRECLLDVGLAKSFAQIAVGKVYAT